MTTHAERERAVAALRSTQREAHLVDTLALLVKALRAAADLVERPSPSGNSAREIAVLRDVARWGETQIKSES